MNYQELFSYLNTNLDVQITQDEAYDIIDIVRKIISEPQAEASSVSENEQAKESNDLEDNAYFYYCRACLAIHEEECCCELDD